MIMSTVRQTKLLTICIVSEHQVIGLFFINV